MSVMEVRIVKRPNGLTLWLTEARQRIRSSRWFDEFYSHRGTKTLGIRIQMPVDRARDAVTHERLAEVEQVSELEARES